MAIAGTLTVNVLAETRKFNKGMEDARKKLGRFGKETKASSNVLKRFGVALAGALTIGAIQRFTVGVIHATDALAKTASKLGTSTDQLGFWRFAAEQAGVSANTLDMAFQRMVRRIGQAAQGTGEAVKTLNKFGIDAKSLAQLDPAEQFKLIGENINAITNQNEKLATAMSLFDSEGVALVNLFASDLGKAATNFKELGLAIGTADAAKIEALSDSLNKLGDFLSATGRGIVVDISDAAVAWLDNFTRLLNDIKRSEFFKFVTSLESIGPKRRGFVLNVPLQEFERQMLEARRSPLARNLELRRQHEIVDEELERSKRNKLADEQTKLLRSQKIKLGTAGAAFAGALPRAPGREALQFQMQADVQRRQLFQQMRQSALAPGRRQLTPFAGPQRNAAREFLREQLLAIHQLAGASRRVRGAPVGERRQARQEFMEAVRQRREMIQNSRLSLEVQRDLVRRIGQIAGPQLSPAQQF